MKTTLKQIKFTYFKGIKDLEILFDEQTDIYGDNGTGKTTIFDAFTWLLFGKDHADNAKFEIKTLDENNQAIPQIEHEVEGVLLVDDEEITLKRIYREKWVKRRGSTEAELTGHETLYFWNDVPLSQKEYQAKISEIIDENIFKLVTNPLYFNTMKWQDRRALLTEIAGEVNDIDALTLQSKQEILALTNVLNSTKTIDEYKKEVVARKKKIKTELEQIPTRVDELSKSLPEQQNWTEIEAEIKAHSEEVGAIDSQLQDQSKISDSYYKEVESKRAKLYELKRRKSDFENEANKQISEKLNTKQENINKVKDELRGVQYEIKANDFNLKKATEEHSDIDTKIANLRNEFAQKRDEQLKIDEHQFTCPTCKRAFETEDIEAKKAELHENFNTNKAKELEAINTKGKALNEEKTKLQEEIKEYKKRSEQLNAILANVQKDLTDTEKAPAGVESTQAIFKNNQEYQEVLEDIEALESLLAETKAINTQTDEEAIKKLKLQKSGLVSKIDKLKEILATRKQIEQGETRIKELTTQQKDLAQQLADTENEEFTITAFVSAKINKVEEAVNQLFPTVRFKMFCEQLNGGTAECCETLINGVPFSDTNNAAKIQSGIEIINILSKHYGFYAPIFIDNAESVTTLPSTESQVIRLIVSDKHKSLTIK